MMMKEGTMSGVKQKHAVRVRALEGLGSTWDADEQLALDEGKFAEREAVMKEVRAACLGYAKVCFATNNDLGRGPTIARAILNPRRVQASGVQQLKQLHKN